MAMGDIGHRIQWADEVVDLGFEYAIYAPYVSSSSPDTPLEHK